MTPLELPNSVSITSQNEGLCASAAVADSLLLKNQSPRILRAGKGYSSVGPTC